MKAIPIIPGERFFNWTIVCKVKPQKGQVYVRVECDCGNKRNVRYALLREGRSKCEACSTGRIYERVEPEMIEKAVPLSPEEQIKQQRDFIMAKRSGREILHDGHFSFFTE